MSGAEPKRISDALLAALPEGARQSVGERKLARDQHLFGRGEVPAYMYCVVSGEVHLQRTSEAGSLLVFQRLREGFVSEASLFQTTYHCDAVAVAPTIVRSIPIEIFREGLRQEAFQERWLRHLGQELRRARTQSERLGLHTVRERIIHYVETEGSNGAVRLGFPVKAWAGDLGVAHEVLYRTLKSMKLAGEIATDGPLVRLLRIRDRT